MLTEKQIHEFQTLYKKKFDKDISRDEAYSKGINLIRLMAIIYKPMTEEEYKKLQ